MMMMTRFHTLFALSLLLLGSASGQNNETNEEITPIMAQAGMSVQIPCKYTMAENETLYSLVWKYEANDVAILAMNELMPKGNYISRVEVDKDTYDLTLMNVQFEDAGVYSYDLITSKGSGNGNEHVKVFAVPEVAAQSVPVVLQSGYETTREKKHLAECKAVGGSLPFSMHWVTIPEYDVIIGDSFRTDDVNPENKELVDSTLPLLLLPDPSRNNGRKFACVVEDAIGRETYHFVTAKVTVFTTTPPTTTMQAIPKIVSFPTLDINSAKISVGETRSFKCEITGVPAPNVVWYKDVTNMLSGGIGNAVLTLTVETYDDAGRYTCKGQNEEGSVSNSFELSVQGPPVVVVEDKWSNDTEEIVIKPDEEIISLSCEASAFPLPEITWEIEKVNMSKALIDENISIGQNVIISTVNLSLFHANSESKRVKCIAVNIVGRSSKKFIVSSEDVEVSNAGLVVGVVIAVIVVLALVFIIVFFTLQSQRQGKGEVTTPENAEKGCLSCTPLSALCGGKKATNKEISGSDNTDEVKEVREEGTKEEKQKLTEAEEQPAEKESNSGDDNSADDTPEEMKEKKKMGVSFPLKCCSGNKKQLKEEDSVNDDAEKTAVKEGKVKPSEEKLKDKHVDSDSGKGDTLEKVV